MNAAQVLDHFDRICDAPDAIPRLRRLILDLAVWGKLVDQDPNDEPASEVLKRILVEKAEKTKRQRTRIENEVDNISFVLPAGWEVVLLGSLCVLENGDRSKNYPSRDEFVKEGIPFINAGHLQFGGICLDSMNFISEKTFDLLKSGKVRNGDILFCLRGSLGKAALVGGISRGAIASSLVIIRLMTGVSPRFVLNYLSSSLATDMVGRFDNGTAQPNLSSEDLGRFVFPLPPIAEQRRIVAKVDELMALCDCLEAAQTERESRRDKLVAASLHRLNNGADADQFREGACFHLRHLPCLTTRSEHIQRLRQTILNLAVRGKLVPQDPNDEPASAVGISSPKGSRGRRAEERPEDDAWPNEVPSSWKWHRLGSISEQITDGEHATPPRIHDEQVPLVTAKNVRDGFMDYGKTDWVSFETANKAWVRCRPTIGDVLLVCVGATTGRLCVLREGRDMVLVRSVALIRPTSAINVDYLALALRSPMCQAQMWEKVKMTAQPCLYINRINSLPIPLPPLAEQYRIVAKVDELMTLCDRLEAQLTTTQTESHRFLEAVLHEALNLHTRND